MSAKPEFFGAHDTPQQVVIAARGDWEGEISMEQMAQEWANCTHAEIDDDGDVHVEGPQAGRWLDDDELIDFLSWLHDRLAI